MSGKGKKVAQPPKSALVKKATGGSKKENFNDSHPHLFSKAPRDFRIGRDLPPTRDLTRYVRWPRYVRLQRQRAILKKRLKVPPAVNQFTRTLDKNQAGNVFRLLSHYRPESAEEKKNRLKTLAAGQVDGKEQKASTKPLFIKYGLNHVTELIEAKKAKLVVIAHDVDPIELVVWLPALCRKMNVPYCIVKGKARLGFLVHKKNASVLALTEVKKEDHAKLDQVVQSVRLQFNDNLSERRKWGGGILGNKALAVIRKRERTQARELASKAQA